MTATATKPARKLSVLARHKANDGTLMTMVEIQVGKVCDLYYVSPCVPFSGSGRSWLFQGLGRKSASHYEVNLSGDVATCECVARVACCRHVACVRKLLELGSL